MSIKVRYYRAEDTQGEMCVLDKINTDKNTPCYHCGSLIAANTPAAKLRTVDDTYILHRECILKCCNQHPAEQGMYRRLERFLQDDFSY